jgi:hypothetical protein
MKVVLPDIFLLQAAEESLDDSILLGCVRSDELLRQPIVATGRTESPALKDESVVASHDGSCTFGFQGAKPGNAGLLDRPLGFLRPTSRDKLPTPQLPIMAVDHPHQVGPAIAGRKATPALASAAG